MTAPTSAATPSLSELYSDSEREARIAAIEREMLASGVKHVYFQYVTIQGRVLAKVVPTEFWAKAAARGLSWTYVTAAGMHIGHDGSVFGAGGASTREGLLMPDLDTWAILPWDREMSRVFCTHYRRLDVEEEGPGEPTADDCRHTLKRALQDLHAETGLTAKSGCEPEMSWFPDANSLDTSCSRLPQFVSPSYHVRHLEDLRAVLKKVTEYGAAMGFEMIQADYEDPGQLECNFAFDDFLATADRIITYRQICVQVADELDMVATFMPKPIAGIMANGCHHHVSFWRDGENILVDPSSKSRENLTEVGRHTVGGLLSHARNMMAVLAPTVNSYKRYLDANWSPTHANWGYDNRACACRVVPGRIEVRTPDATANPYLSHLAILAAARDGWENQIDPGPPQEGETPPRANGGPGFASLPITLADALDAFEGDPVLAAALPPELREVFLTCKRDEWLRFCAAITEWDIETYLNYLP